MEMFLILASFVAGLFTGILAVSVTRGARSRELEHVVSQASAAALERNGRQFLEIARGALAQEQIQARGELERREQAVAHLVEPLRDTLAKIETQFARIERSRAGSEQQLLSQLTSLERATGGLAAALHSPRARGRWGEMHLRRVVEVAGMLDRCDFEEQPVTHDGEGRRMRPDMVIRLAGGRSVAVDAKAPLDAWLASLDEDRPDERERLLREHAARVRAHVRSLRGREYARHLDPGTSLVVLFLPTEDMFRVALEHDPLLLEDAARQDVALATPSTLIVLLRSVAQGWREEALASNAARISELGGELYNRIATFSEHLARVGRALTSGVEQYNRAVGALEHRVLPATRQLRDLDVPTAKDVVEPTVVTRVPRALPLTEPETWTEAAS